MDDKQNSTKAVTRDTFEQVMTAYATAIKSQRNRLDALEQVVEELKARPLQKWAGVHVAGTRYSEASLVTKAGSLWVATTTTTMTPGTSGDWRLVVKNGGGR